VSVSPNRPAMQAAAAAAHVPQCAAIAGDWQAILANEAHLRVTRRHVCLLRNTAHQSWDPDCQLCAHLHSLQPRLHAMAHARKQAEAAISAGTTAAAMEGLSGLGTRELQRLKSHSKQHAEKPLLAVRERAGGLACVKSITWKRWPSQCAGCSEQLLMGCTNGTMVGCTDGTIRGGC
jgi:hypothetical protein